MVLFVSIISSQITDHIYSPISHFPFVRSFSFLVYDSIRSIYAHATMSEHPRPEAVNHFGSSTVYSPIPESVRPPPNHQSTPGRQYASHGYPTLLERILPVPFFTQTPKRSL